MFLTGIRGHDEMSKVLFLALKHRETSPVFTSVHAFLFFTTPGYSVLRLVEFTSVSWKHIGSREQTDLSVYAWGMSLMGWHKSSCTVYEELGSKMKFQKSVLLCHLVLLC